MVDRNYTKIEEGQDAIANYMGHHLDVEIYEVENDVAYFRTKDQQGGQPSKGQFNRIECSRYLTVTKNRSKN